MVTAHPTIVAVAYDVGVSTAQPASESPPRAVLPTTLERLEDSLVLHNDRLVSWLVTIGLVVFAFVLRIINLARPNRLVFDETYYAKDAWTLLHNGYESTWPKGSDEQIIAGTVDGFTDSASYIVHPQLGKWLIAAGEHFFGMNSFGWRIAAVVFGSLLVGMTVRMARRLSRSTLVGALAGFFLCIDGLHFMMSRIALLDIFQAFFTVAAVAAVVKDRDWFREKLAAHLRATGQANLGGRFGPLFLWRPWRLLAGIMFGLAIGVKWNSVYVLAVMGITSVIFDVRARYTAGARAKAWNSVLIEAPIAFIYMVISALITYIGTWASWFATSGGWKRDWGSKHPDHILTRLFGEDLASLMEYHREIYAFHVGDFMSNQTHDYEAHPAGWLVIGRTIGIDAINDIQPGVDGCKAAAGETCLRVISGTGTPFLWWFAAIALVAGLVFWIGGRDWRFGVPIVSMLATWLMWFPNADRPLFYFYAIMIIPFTATVLAMCLGKILGSTEDRYRRQLGATVVGAVVLLILANFIFIYPILTDEIMTRRAWQLRMWFRSWV